MKRLCLSLCSAAVLVSNPGKSLAGEWPKLMQGTKGKCAEALQIATSTFNSQAFYLFASPEVPKDLDSVLVLHPQALDISGGDALEADQAVFDKLPLAGDGARRSAYWGKTAVHGYRWVVVETPFGWRGDMYSLFAIAENETSDEVLLQIREKGHAGRFATIVSDSWRPPLILQGRNFKPAWIIDVGQPYQFLADWRVHISEPDGPKLECTIQFRPIVKRAASILPQPVQELARLLDQTMGRGENEGTLQPTARLRLDAEYTWANVALRPWALGTPYNSRAEVDGGLKSWSRSGSTYRAIYLAIQKQYLLAEQSLARYYQTAFQRSSRDAQILSAYSLDVAFRSHYTFHSNDPEKYQRRDGAELNPWRSK